MEYNTTQECEREDWFKYSLKIWEDYENNKCF
jgi:hypothetical protein